MTPEKNKQMVFKVKDLSEALGIGRDAAYALMRSKAFPSMRLGRTYIVSKDNFMEWLNQNKHREFVL